MPQPPPPLPTRLKAYLSPLSWLIYAIFNHVYLLLTTFPPFSPLFDLPSLRRAAYSRLWLATGSSFASSGLPGPTISLLQSTQGKVLEIGAGSGELIRFYDPQRVSEVVGVEPARELFERLRENARAVLGNVVTVAEEERHGLDGQETNGENGGSGPDAGNGTAKYIILPTCASTPYLFPALEKSGLLPPGWTQTGVFDEIICVRVLCMVPCFPETVEGLWTLLKPGGRMVVCEHGVNGFKFPWEAQIGGSGSGKRMPEERAMGKRSLKGKQGYEEKGLVSRFLQLFYSCLGWSFWMGDCHLQRDIEGVLRDVGGGKGWEEVSLETVDAWSVLPYTVGHLIKRRADDECLERPN